MRSGDIDNIKQVYGALEDYAAVERAVGVWEVDTVIHLGAQTLVGSAARVAAARPSRPTSAGTYHLLEACRVHAAMIKAVVVASSDKAYGTAPELPYTEETPLRAQHPYDVSKACADLLAQTYHDTYGLPVADRAVRQHLRRRRSQLEPHRAGHDPVAAARRAADHPQRRPVRSRLPLRQGCGVGISVSRRGRCTPAGIAAGAVNFSGDARRTVLEVVADLQRLTGRTELTPDIQNTATAEIREQWLSSDKAPGCSDGRPPYTLEQGLRRPSTGTGTGSETGSRRERVPVCAARPDR